MGEKPSTNQKSNDSQDELVLDSVFKNKALTRLIIIQDCLSQAGLPILFQIIQQVQSDSTGTQLSSSFQDSNQQSKSQQDVLLIKTTSDLLLDQFLIIQSKSKAVNAASSFQSIDLAQLNHHKLSDPENHKFVLDVLVQLVRQAISGLHATKPLSILVDTIQELFRLSSIHQTFSFVKNLLNLLPNAESRLIILDSPHLNLNDSLEKIIIEPSIGLKSLALSTSYLHLRIHPTSLIDHLINDFGLTVPLQSTKQPGTHYDMRLFQLIHELAPTCDAYLRGNSTPDKNGLTSIPQALLIPNNSSSTLESQLLASCVIEWTAQNFLSPASSSRPSASITSHSKKSLKSQHDKSCNNLSSVQHGLEGLQLSLDPLSSVGFQLTPVPISSVIKKRLFKLSMPVGHHTQANSNLDPLQSQLTFNLSLTEKQRVDREAVELPFLPKRSDDGTVIKAPGEMYDGSFQETDPIRSGGVILYEPDSADDFDDEEPDDD